MIGLIVMYVFSMVNPSFWKQAAYPFMGIGMILMFLVFIPGIGVEMGGSHRWLRLPFGMYLQPSEFVKYALIKFIAASLAKKGDSIRDFAIGFLPHLLVMGAVVFFILMQPDFGYSGDNNGGWFSHALCRGRSPAAPSWVCNTLSSLSFSGGHQCAIPHSKARDPLSIPGWTR